MKDQKKFVLMVLMSFLLTINACQPQESQEQDADILIGELGSSGGELKTPLLPEGKSLSIPEFVASVRKNKPEEYKKHKVALERLLDRYYLREFVNVLFASRPPPGVTVASSDIHEVSFFLVVKHCYHPFVLPFL